MDELEFRRRVYADPDSKDSDIIAAAEANKSQKQFLSDIRKLNEQVKRAMDIPVPDDLANKIIWQSSVNEHNKQKRQTRVHIAMAASIAFAIGLTFSLWQPNKIDIGEAALAHMSHASVELALTASTVSLESVNGKLSTLGAELNGSFGNVQAANYCQLDKVKSLHLIIDTDQGPISVFFLSHHEEMSIPNSFSDNQYVGLGFSKQNTHVLVVGNKQSDLNLWKNKVKDSLI